jgi:hypothetical protein
LLVGFVYRHCAHAEDRTAGGGFVGQPEEVRLLHAGEGRQECELMLVGDQVIVDEQAVALLARSALQGKGDQAAESALGKSVLAWEEAIVAREPQLRTPFYGQGQQKRAQRTCGERQKRFGKEDPLVASLPGSGALEDCRDSPLPAHRQEGQGIVFPARVVEVDHQQPAGLVPE